MKLKEIQNRSGAPATCSETGNQNRAATILILIQGLENEMEWLTFQLPFAVSTQERLTVLDRIEYLKAVQAEAWRNF